LIVRVNALPALTHPLEFETLKNPVYIPAATPAGTDIFMGLAGNDILPTLNKPAVEAAEFQKIEYAVGELVVAL
jgi:hypothetical protein